MLKRLGEHSMTFTLSLNISIDLKFRAHSPAFGPTLSCGAAGRGCTKHHLEMSGDFFKAVGTAVKLNSAVYI